MGLEKAFSDGVDKLFDAFADLQKDVVIVTANVTQRNPATYKKSVVDGSSVTLKGLFDTGTQRTGVGIPNSESIIDVKNKDLGGINLGKATSLIFDGDNYKIVNYTTDGLVTTIFVNRL